MRNTERLIIVQSDAGDVEALYLVNDYDGRCMECFINAKKDYLSDMTKWANLQYAIDYRLAQEGYGFNKLMRDYQYSVL